MKTKSRPQKKCSIPRCVHYAASARSKFCPECFVNRPPPYSVREWCRFLTKLSRLLSKSDCFQPVSFGTPCNPPFRCRGVSIISFACVMADSSTLKHSQTAAEGLQSSIFVLQLCLLAEMKFSVFVMVAERFLFIYS